MRKQTVSSLDASLTDAALTAFSSAVALPVELGTPQLRSSYSTLHSTSASTHATQLSMFTICDQRERLDYLPYLPSVP